MGKGPRKPSKMSKNCKREKTTIETIADNIPVLKCNIFGYTVRFKERVTREPNFSSSQKRVSRDHSLSSSLKEKVSRDHSLNPSLETLVLCSPE